MAKQRSATLVTDLETARERVQALETDLSDLKTNMSATGSANSVLQAQNEVLRVEVDRINVQLHNALTETMVRYFCILL